MRFPASLLLLFAGLPLFGATNELKRYSRLADAEAALFPTKDVTYGWGAHKIARGGSTQTINRTIRRDANGYAGWSSWTVNVKTLSGTLIAVPIGDFKEESMFEYVSPDGSGAVLTGLVASVEVQLSAGSKSPAEHVMQKTVENLARSGMALSEANGGRPMRIMSLRKAASMRYGGKNPHPHYHAKKGKVYLLVEDCELDKGDPSFVPATPEGATKRERDKLRKLHRDEDRGGTTVIRNTTESFW